MPRQQTRSSSANPFYVLLGVVGVLFTITASSYCVFVLRGVQAATVNASEPPAAFEQLMDRHGTTILAGQLLLLAAATVGAVAVDHVRGQREMARRREAKSHATATSSAEAASEQQPGTQQS